MAPPWFIVAMNYPSFVGGGAELGAPFATIIYEHPIAIELPAYRASRLQARRSRDLPHASHAADVSIQAQRLLLSGAGGGFPLVWSMAWSTVLKAAAACIIIVNVVKC